MSGIDARAKQISDIQHQLGTIQFANSSTASSPRYSEEYERAALLSSFGSEELRLRSDPVRELLRDCAVVLLDEEARYVLNDDVRRRVLRQLGSRGRMQRTLDSIDPLPSDPLQVAINRIVDDERLVDADSSLTWLHTAYRALSWFLGIIDTEPLPPVRARIETAGFLERFERLVGENFRGRVDELRTLRSYVDVDTNPDGSMELSQKPALVVTGPGGIGKSTLLAKFILDHAKLAEDRQLPYAYLNFDSPTVRAGEPKTLLVEAVRQLAIQYPSFAITLGKQRDRWQEALLELSRQTGSARLARDHQLTDVFRREFASLLTSIQIDRRPLLFILDTFEVVQERQRGDIAALYRFLRELQNDYPALRVVISGRAGLDDAVNRSPSAGRDSAGEIPTRELRLTGLDRATSIDYLIFAGLTAHHAEQVARYLIPDEATDEGASPLSLRVAAEVWQRDLERSGLDSSFWAQLRAGRIQAQLITRYVRHTDPHSAAGQLALPSLLLRRITADALAAIVAPAWRVSLNAGQAAATFLELGSLISLVVEHASGELVPRQEVQRQIVDLLSDLESDRVGRLHELAVDHYAELSERPDATEADRDQARLDEIIHRLARGDDELVVRERWRVGCSMLVTGRVPLLSSAAQAVLEQLAGLELTTGMRTIASRNTWEADAIRRARHALESGSYQDVVAVADERDDWNRASELSLLLAQAHLARQKPLDAFDDAVAAIGATEPGLATGLACDLHQSAAEAAYELYRPQDALTYVDDALVIAREREDLPRLVAGLLVQAQVQQHRDERAAAVAVGELERQLPLLDGPLGERDIVRLFSLLTHFPELVSAAVRCGGLAFLPPASVRQVARHIAAVDKEVSEARGVAPGVLAKLSGLSLTASVTRTWQDALDRGPEVAEAGVLEALRSDVPARVGLINTLADAFAAVTASGRQPVAAPVATLPVTLNARRRDDLVEALLTEFGRDQVDAVLALEFDRSLSSLTSLDEGDEHALTTLVEVAERESWIAAFVIAVRNRRPDAPRLLQIANELDVSTIHFSTGRLATVVGPDDLDTVLGRLGLVEGRIGRLEYGSDLCGTGLLVAPEILLVAASSLDRVLESGAATQFVVRFGMKADSKGRRFDEGAVFALGPGWLIDRIPVSGGSGFALVRLEGFPADEPLGGSRGQRDHMRRGFADIASSAELVEGRNALICWQQAARLELHVERRAIARDGDRFTVPALGDSAAGSPCFNRSMEFLGLVLEERSGRARLMPGPQLWQSLVDRGHGDTVNVALT